MFRILLRIVGWMIRLALFAVWFLLPWIIRGLIFTLMLMLTALGSLWRGLPETVEIMANDWLKKAIDAGCPIEWEERLHSIFRALASFTVVTGWVIVALLAVFIVERMFL